MAKKKKIGVDSDGHPCWKLNDLGDYVRVMGDAGSKTVFIRTPKELMVETITTLVDLLHNNPEIAIEIQDRLRF